MFATSALRPPSTSSEAVVSINSFFVPSSTLAPTLLSGPYHATLGVAAACRLRLTTATTAAAPVASATAPMARRR